MTSPTPSAEMEMEMELLPCPFCGAKPTQVKDGAGWPMVSCKCGASLESLAAVHDPIAAWNSRPSDPVRAELETTVDDTKLAYQIMIALGESPDVRGSLEPGANRRVDIVASVLAARRPTSTRREVLEEAASAIEGMGWSTAEQAFAAQEAAALLRSLASEGG